MRTFDTGATRDSDDTKPDYEGYLSPLVIERFGQYMTKHRVQSDGTLRASDNWQKGIPRDAYIKSAFRHFMDWWAIYRGRETRATSRQPGSRDDHLEDALCALIFNAQGYLHEHLKADGALPQHGPWCVGGCQCETQGTRGGLLNGQTIT